MTIKEIEDRSGMTRANIRFYESEGLLSPERKENGYREYSEDDLATLLRIRLLRSLGISLDDIRALQAGEAALSDALARRLDALSSEQASLDRSREVCREMRDDGAQYATLDAARYLDALSRESPAAVPASDAVPKVRAPWRRYFARTFDLTLYGFAFDITLMLVFHANYAGDSAAALRLLDLIAGIAGMLFLEPLLLSRFGTTPGKWLLGLAVTAPDGGRLRYRDARKRAVDIFVYGFGVYIPIYNLLRLYRSYTDCAEGQTLPWEYDSVLTLRDEKPWRAIAYCVACAALSGAFMLAFAAAGLPPHRGDLTVAELCDNYNRVLEYHKSHSFYRLDESGNWMEYYNGNGVVIDIFGGTPRPELVFTEEDGYVTGVSFEQTLTNNSFPPSYSALRQYMVIAFAGAQKGAGLYMGEARKAADRIAQSPYGDLDDAAYGVRIVSGLDFAGYLGDGSDDWLFAEDGASTMYSIRFSMSK